MNHNGEETVRIAEFKAKLSYYLKGVQQGRALTILDRDHPVAQVVPYRTERLATRKATRKLKDIKLPPPLNVKVDSLAILLEDRKDRF